MKKYILYGFVATSLAAFLFSCGGGGGGSSEVPLVATTSAELVAFKGLPRMFNIECSKYAYNADTGNWHPQNALVRTETWFYSSPSGSEVLIMINGEIIGRKVNDSDISKYPAPNIDPRRFGCAEPIDTVVTVLDGVEIYSTEGSEIEAEFVNRNIYLKSVYYTVNNSQSAVNVTYSKDKMMGMVTL